MGGKRVEPTGHYEAREHPSIKGLVNLFWCPNEGHPDTRPMLTLGESAVPMLAEALADWELAHKVPPPPRNETGRSAGHLRAVNDDGVI